MRYFWQSAALVLTGLVFKALADGGDFNITSPLDHGVYVAGQMLPITYVLLGDTTDLELEIFLKPSSELNSSTVTVAQPADVSEDPSSIVTIDNRTYWQHSYNYKIPETAPAGSYYVIFSSFGYNTTVPISIRAYTPMPSTSLAPSTPSSSASGILSDGSSSSVHSSSASHMLGDPRPSILVTVMMLGSFLIVPLFEKF
ncbi:hypothetical protein BCR43DRAFT_523919 [Syncephalastrum racemosum]|uniref:Ser-Thr-rich glycosyl-phosphatidyl-inositol-anchored membrane family-domain-containing protein n=1 Tax=Syncephalastrum racemosum TaxID=13706 RepID=A0A1X2HFR5_SYNRA|nr:hypothetical protein BCR43DRAFT_523919 [Syncephalastrum racemosum]